MKKLVITLILTSLAGMLSAQSVQHGFVKEYNGLAAPAQYEKRLQQYYEIYKKLL